MKLLTTFETICAECPDYLRDESRVTAAALDAIAWPESEEDIAVALQTARANGWGVTVSAARTGICGAAVPLTGGMVLSLEKLNAILGIGYDEQAREWFMTAQPGVTLQEISDCLQARQFGNHTAHWPAAALAALERLRRENVALFYPPVVTEMTAALGGTVATNASGARSFKYGATRAWIRRLRVALADGSFLDLRRGGLRADESNTITISRPTRPDIVIALPTYTLPRTKHVAGYYVAPRMELLDLFIGSEGTLGIVTEVEIRLMIREKELFGVTTFFRAESDAVEFAAVLRNAARAKLLDIESIEFAGERTLRLLRQRRAEGDNKVPEIPAAAAALCYEIAFRPETMDAEYAVLENYLQCAGVAPEHVWAGTTPAEIQSMKQFRHAIPEAVNQIVAERKRSIPALHKIATDLAVPDEHLAPMLEHYRATLDAAGLEYYIFGHIGDNHLHVNMVPRDEAELARAKEFYRAFAVKAVALGGTVSAEHGIGKLKREFLKIMFGEQGIAEMKAVKRALDPAGILGPGTLF